MFVAYVLWVVFLWHPYKDVPREQFAHYIHALVRYYQDSASILVTARHSQIPLFRFRRAVTHGDGCDLLFEVLDSPLTAPHRDKLLDEIRKQGYEPTRAGESTDGDWPITVAIRIRDIWQVSAGNLAARLANEVLNAMGIDREARYSLSVKGSRSRERTLEARRRQEQGLDLGGIDLKK